MPVDERYMITGGNGIGKVGKRVCEVEKGLGDKRQLRTVCTQL
jgi:hypothetical protein